MPAHGSWTQRAGERARTGRSASGSNGLNHTRPSARSGSTSCPPPAVIASPSHGGAALGARAICGEATTTTVRCASPMDATDRLHVTDRDLEDQEDALLEGDRVLETSAARAALRHRDFRVVWMGAFASNIGTWMQNVTLGALAYALSHSAVFVSLVTFAQLGPLLVLSIVGGALADTVDRRRLTVLAQAGQMIGAVILGFVVLGDDPSRTAIVVTVLGIG